MWARPEPPLRIIPARFLYEWLMGNFLKSWGWDYNPNRANAFHDIVFIVGAFVLGFWLMKSEDLFSKIVVSYCIASIIAGILFVIRLNVIYEQGCLMTIVLPAQFCRRRICDFVVKHCEIIS